MIKYKNHVVAGIGFVAGDASGIHTSGFASDEYDALRILSIEPSFFILGLKQIQKVFPPRRLMTKSKNCLKTSLWDMAPFPLRRAY